MSFAPGTIFRAFIADKSKHYTAVLLKNGSYLEVKNPDNNNTKTVFESLEEWTSSHDIDISQIVPETLEQKRERKEVKSTLKLEFPEKGKAPYVFNWGIWCYNIIKILDKSLLKQPDFIKAFNDIYEIWDKYKQNISTGDWYNKKDIENFNPNKLLYRTTKKNWKGEDEEDEEDIWRGLSWSFREEYWNNKKYSKEYFDEHRGIIIPYYKKLYDLIAPILLPKMTNKYQAEIHKKKIKEAKSNINFYEKLAKKEMRKIENRMKEIKYYEERMNKWNTTAIKFQNELIEAESKLKSLEEASN
jgi:hypothetical protein